MLNDKILKTLNTTKEITVIDKNTKKTDQAD